MYQVLSPVICNRQRSGLMTMTRAEPSTATNCEQLYARSVNSVVARHSVCLCSNGVLYAHVLTVECTPRLQEACILHSNAEKRNAAMRALKLAQSCTPPLDHPSFLSAEGTKSRHWRYKQPVVHPNVQGKPRNYGSPVSAEP